ncbi:hypothetical protein ACTHQY_15125 [Rhodococcoides corynebacterioides]|uniref:hypothetical protein n=1 Tax=Rhodococcoides corynebacterioides TaxID=53972 RepID=UPI003F8084B0
MARVADYIECTRCARRSTTLLVDLDSGECANCSPVTLPPAVAAANALNARSGFGPLERVR